MAHLSNVDANLFVVLDALLREGSATGAARRLHVTQSAVSNALGRLRELFGDPLFVRAGRGLSPTPRLLELAPRIHEGVALLASALHAQHAFDPQTTTRCFRLVCPDSAELSQVPRLVRLCAERLPRAQVEIMTVDAFVSAGAFPACEADAAIAPASLGGAGIHQLPLYDEEPVIIARKGHPVVKRSLSRADFAALPYVEVDVVRQGSVGKKMQGKILAHHGISLNVVARVPHFLAAAAVVAETDCIAGLARSFAEAVARMLPLSVVPYPLTPVPGFPIALTWHERTHQDPGSRLFRTLVERAFARPSARRRGKHKRT